MAVATLKRSHYFSARSRAPCSLCIAWNCGCGLSWVLRGPVAPTVWCPKLIQHWSLHDLPPALLFGITCLSLPDLFPSLIEGPLILLKYDTSVFLSALHGLSPLIGKAGQLLTSTSAQCPLVLFHIQVSHLSCLTTSPRPRGEMSSLWNGLPCALAGFFSHLSFHHEAGGFSMLESNAISVGP
jgi:hypothetical protein